MKIACTFCMIALRCASHSLDPNAWANLSGCHRLANLLNSPRLSPRNEIRGKGRSLCLISLNSATHKSTTTDYNRIACQPLPSLVVAAHRGLCWSTGA